MISSLVLHSDRVPFRVSSRRGSAQPAPAPAAPLSAACSSRIPRSVAREMPLTSSSRAPQKSAMTRAAQADRAPTLALDSARVDCSSPCVNGCACGCEAQQRGTHGTLPRVLCIERPRKQIACAARVNAPKQMNSALQTIAAGVTGCGRNALQRQRAAASAPGPRGACTKNGGE